MNPDDPWIGRLIGESQRYLIQQHLGGGSMGNVFVALDTRLGQQVAIKVLKSNLAGADDLIRRFEHEVELCAALRGEHVIQVSDYGITSEGYPFYVMEYLKGQTLGQLLRQEKRLPIERTVHIITQVCEGLERAHAGVILPREGQRIKVVHRDLKPDNIFLVPTSLGELAKILDFGIAKIRHDQREETHLTNMFIGTFRFASPEQIEVKQDIDGRSDIYSLGVILYEMLSGTDPFGYGPDAHDISQMAWAIAHVSQAPIPLRQQPGCEHLPAALEDAVMRCLAKAPDHRFATVTDLSKALQAAISVTVSNTQGGWQLKPVLAEPSASARSTVPRLSVRRSVDESVGHAASVARSQEQNGRGTVPAQASTAVLLPNPEAEPVSRRRISPLILAIAGVAIAVPVALLIWKFPESRPVSSPMPSLVSDAQLQLNQAIALATAGKFSEAIEVAVDRIPADSPIATAAKPYIDRWSRQLLAQAENSFRSGTSQSALTLALTQLQGIPASSSSYADAQTKKQQWPIEWKTAEQLQEQIKQADSQEHWQTVLDLTAKLPHIRYWQEAAKPLADRAKQKLEAPAPVPLPTDYSPQPVPLPVPSVYSPVPRPAPSPAPEPIQAKPLPGE